MRIKIPSTLGQDDGYDILPILRKCKLIGVVNVHDPVGSVVGIWMTDKRGTDYASAPVLKGHNELPEDYDVEDLVRYAGQPLISGPSNFPIGKSFSETVCGLVEFQHTPVYLKLEMLASFCIHTTEEVTISVNGVRAD